ncbi:hypothetical protein EUGRSUZ_L00283 [Eucalyptus grandis]|uniref:Uncharacterized protein n=2 Tax=Eucalyptus grandis TaxID=71139 RepID=A0A058ZVQ2_EUCGR|nr:hypothetical protein EUGRSUZ_L00283 [Eucalyptus grandis]
MLARIPAARGLDPCGVRFQWMSKGQQGRNQLTEDMQLLKLARRRHELLLGCSLENHGALGPVKFRWNRGVEAARWSSFVWTARESTKRRAPPFIDARVS